MVTMIILIASFLFGPAIVMILIDLHKKRHMSTLFLIRGLPGSGKTTLGAEIAQRMRINHYEIDDYFYDEGKYKFDATKLGLAHDACFQNFENELEASRSVIVSNNFTRWHEMRDYIDRAIEEGYRVKVITCLGNFNSVHNVSNEIMERMKTRFMANNELPKIPEVEYTEHIPVAEMANNHVTV